MSSIPTTPHQETPRHIEEAIAEINALSADEIVKLKIHEVLRLAIPEKEVSAVAEETGVPAGSLYKWRLDPDLFTEDGSEKKYDPTGRRSLPHHSNLFTLRLNRVFPPGAEFLLRWQTLQLAEAQAIQGRRQAQAILQIADEADSIINKVQAIETEVREWKARIIAAAAGSALRKT